MMGSNASHVNWIKLVTVTIHNASPFQHAEALNNTWAILRPVTNVKSAKKEKSQQLIDRHASPPNQRVHASKNTPRRINNAMTAGMDKFHTQVKLIVFVLHNAWVKINTVAITLTATNAKPVLLDMYQRLIDNHAMNTNHHVHAPKHLSTMLATTVQKDKLPPTNMHTALTLQHVQDITNILAIFQIFMSAEPAQTNSCQLMIISHAKK